MHPLVEGAIFVAPLTVLLVVAGPAGPADAGDILEKYGVLAAGVGGLWLAYQRLVATLLKALAANTEAMKGLAGSVSALSAEVRDLRGDFRAVESRTAALEQDQRDQRLRERRRLHEQE